MSPLQVQLDRIRRRRWLVVAITLTALVIGGGSALMEQTTYTGSSTLTITSPNRGPEQDAVLAQGYSEYFNEPSTQDALATKADLPPDVTLSARTAASGPILYIEATAPDRELARSAAQRMALTFRDEVRNTLRAETDRQIAELRARIDDELERLYAIPEGANSPEHSLVFQGLSELQTQVSDLLAVNSNQLKDLQLDAGVVTSAPSVVENALLALLGGLVLGCAAAIGLSVFENRLTTPQDIRERLGLDTLAVISGGRSAAAGRRRAEQLKALANVINLSGMELPKVLAFTSPNPSPAVAEVAGGLAGNRAAQGQRVLVLHANLRDVHAHGGLSDRPSLTVVDYLAAPGGARLMGPAGPGLTIMPAGRTEKDPYALFAPDRFVELVERATKIADLVVIDAPPINDAAEGQVICAAADRVVLIVDQGVTKASEAVQCHELLVRSHADVLGVVLVQPCAGARADNSGWPMQLVAGQPSRLAERVNGTTPATPDPGSDDASDPSDGPRPVAVTNGRTPSRRPRPYPASAEVEVHG